MSTNVSLVYLPLLGIVALLGYVVKQWFFHPLAKYRGPFLASLTNLWSAYLAFRGDWHVVMDQLHKKYGPIVRIAPNEVCISDPAAMKVIYSITGGFCKSDFYEPFRIPTDPPSLFTDRDEARHTERRRLVGSAYTMNSLLKLEPHVQIIISRFVRQLDKLFASTNEVADMSTWFYRMAYDVTGQLAVGRSFNAIDEGDRFGFLSLFMDRNANAGVLGRAPAWARPLIAPFFNTTKIQVYKDITDFMQSSMNVHLTHPEVHSDMMSLMLQLRDAKGEEVLSMDQVQRDCKSVIAAGADTTASTLAGMLHYICKDRRVYQTLQKEIDAASLELEADQPFSATMTEKLPYFAACIQEALRMHSGVGFPLPRVVPEGGAVISGEVFPEGVVVGMNAWQVHRNKDVFGEDADVFRPERWIVTNAADRNEVQRVKNRERHQFAFGAGTRTCIGKHISLLEVRIAIPELMRRFDFTLEHPDRDIEVVNMWFATTRNVKCYIKARS
ncbi:cytochrome P450 [Calocera viscosa TUFC12733]|uniref:Cytochrome P450 n=1 Tax=Calocera viscosa (strain TUFC12733) TaxID=1330018 RepID=A0A167G410_CALVF|nr:cytochrome P450 [Calocera viscosa TUFC12733]